MKGHMALHLLRQLMDMAVKHRNRAKALEHTERLDAILRAPAPGLIEDVQRNMREDDDRLRRCAAFEIRGKPRELVGPEVAEAAALQIDDIDEADEMDAGLIE